MTESCAARLFVAADLRENGAVAVTDEQAHYLHHVLRLGPGDRIALFNGRDGECEARIEALTKKGARIVVGRQRHRQSREPDLWLLFAPIKRQRIDILVEKATELGVAALHPVFTQHTTVDRVNIDRLRAHAIEAAEQTERLTVPTVHAPVALVDALAAWPNHRRLILCAERRQAMPIVDALQGLEPAAAHAVLIGPEGGFADAELDGLVKLPFVTPVSLGPRVLRTDTAAVAALACWQAVLGDWRAGWTSSDAIPA
ncbi:MAG: 16S rRNA (uracil(1498)-N(3))-methyltransferase [Alphaproteobacteria bacterium]|nr:16S rRNA (uracil(1498)-N(3))-methyltransferase [Alphaproteobacteria bacterium]